MKKELYKVNFLYIRDHIEDFYDYYQRIGKLNFDLVHINE